MGDIFDLIIAGERQLTEQSGVDAIEALASEDVASRVTEAMDAMPPGEYLEPDKSNDILRFLLRDCSSNLNEVQSDYLVLCKDGYISCEGNQKSDLTLLKDRWLFAKSELDAAKRVYGITLDADENWEKVIKKCEHNLDIYERATNEAITLSETYQTFSKIFPIFKQLSYAILNGEFSRASLYKNRILEIEPKFNHWPSDRNGMGVGYYRKTCPGL